MTRYARKVDGNHAEIRAAFRRLLGADGVVDCSAFGNGFPDLLVGYGGLCMPVEIKTEKGKLTEKQKKFPLMMRLVRNMDDVAETVKVLKRWHMAISRDAMRQTPYSMDDYPPNDKDV